MATDPSDGSPATLRCGILGTGNIGTDLLVKATRSPVLNVVGVAGIDPSSAGLARARRLRVPASADGIEFLASLAGEVDLVFDATSAGSHRDHAPRLAELGMVCLDLTPAKLGPGVVPVVNLSSHLDAPDLNLVSCGGQATIPIVAAIAAVTSVAYAEIVSTIASASAGPGTRQSIDEFTSTTAGGLEEIGGAQQGKAIIILNPAEPPLLMRNTVFCAIDAAADRAAVTDKIEEIVSAVQSYVPGYRLTTQPVFDADRVAVFLEVEGAGDHLPKYAGNLDIMTAAAIRVAEDMARTNHTAAVA